MSNNILCRQCNQPIAFDNKHISQRTGKKMPLDIETNEPHDCPVRGDQPQQQQVQQMQKIQRRYLQCNKGQEIYFNANSKSQSGKWIPIDKDKGQPQQIKFSDISIQL